MLDEMYKHATKTKDKYGWNVNCKKGLWGVSGESLEDVEREALHYFMQYLSDGEYDDTGTGVVVWEKRAKASKRLRTTQSSS